MPIRMTQGSPIHWVLRIAGFAVIAWLALSPILTDARPDQFGRYTDIAILALAAVSLNLLVGYTGQISIGHSAFFGIGAYTAAILVVDHGWSGGWTFPVAFLVCFVVGVVVGVPALRLRGLYLALVTLSLAVIFPSLVRRFEGFTGGSQGIKGVRYRPPSWTGLDGRAGEAEWRYWLALGMLVLGYLVVRNIVKSRVGRAMVAVRDNETAAAVMGVNRALTKTVTFGISAGLCGLAGAVFAFRQTQANPDIAYFTLIGAIIFLVVMVIGGAASLLGPIVGAVVYYLVDDWTRTNSDRPGLATVIFGGLLIVLMFVAPFGIVGTVKLLSRKVVQVVPRPLATTPADHLLGEAAAVPGASVEAATTQP